MPEPMDIARRQPLQGDLTPLLGDFDAHQVGPDRASDRAFDCIDDPHAVWMSDQWKIGVCSGTIPAVSRTTLAIRASRSSGGTKLPVGDGGGTNRRHVHRPLVAGFGAERRAVAAARRDPASLGLQGMAARIAAISPWNRYAAPSQARTDDPAVSRYIASRPLGW
jgi:hypothetical protein